jgi:sugar fermentation stimulation protein A
VEIEGIGLVGVNTANPNHIAEEAIAAGFIPALAGYPALRREVKYGKNSRIDLLLESSARPPFYVEVKNAHLFRRDGFIEFPDCVTERGTKHLGELARAVRKGARAAMVYLVQADVGRRFTLAGDLDPNYLKAFRRARRAGVEAFALCCKVTPEEITACRVLPVEDL